MPVVGHAFVGLAAAKVVRPARYVQLTDALWMPLVIGLAYLPDMAGQVLLLAGAGDWRSATHSVLFAVVVSLVMAPLLSKAGGLPWRRSFGLVLLCILIHDGLDLLAGTDRQPWWPISNRAMNLGPGCLPADLAHEVLLFGGLWAVFLLARRLFRRRGTAFPADHSVADTRICRKRSVIIGYLLTALILSVACLTHYLRDLRERQLSTAWALLEKGQPKAALATIDQADRWPSTAKPGRADYARAEMYLRLGDRQRAEQYYRKSYRADPTYFWCVADLADFYASGDAPLEQRRRQAEPYISVLRNRFAGHADLPSYMARLARKLSSQPL